MLNTRSSPSSLAGASQAGRGGARASGTLSWIARKPALMPTGFFLLTLLLLAAHQGRAVELLFPMGAFLLAVHLYRTSPPHYLGFVCWLFFLSPEVRRLADFVNGAFNDKSLIMVAPLLAVALCGQSLFKHARKLGQRSSAPLVLIVLAQAYAFVVGVIAVGFAPALYTLVNWVFPALVAFHLTVTWQHYPGYQRVMLNTIVNAGLLMGIYAVVQYIVVPPWDAFWIIEIKAQAFGQPVPYGLRVWSTINSPGTFAVTIMYLVQMSLASRTRLSFLMAIFGVAGLMFTSVRTCWAGLIIGLIYPLAMLDGRSRQRLIGAVVGILLLCAPMMMFDQISEHLVSRMSSFKDISNDNSFQSRADFYEAFFSTALTDIGGEGLGSTGLGAKLSSDNSPTIGGSFDSGLMEVPFVMGWPGTLLYVTGIFVLMWRAFTASWRQPRDHFAICGVGVSIAIFAMMIMVNTLTSTTGMLFFIGVTMPAIGLRYSRHNSYKARVAKTALVPSAAATTTVAPTAVLRAGRRPA